MYPSLLLLFLLQGPKQQLDLLDSALVSCLYACQFLSQIDWYFLVQDLNIHIENQFF